jgi:hypothetical protein
METKVCSRCKEIKAITEYYSDSNGGYLYQCKVCCSKSKKVYISKNKTKVKESKKVYCSTHKVQIINQKKQTSNKRQINIITPLKLERGGKCEICGYDNIGMASFRSQ